MVKIVLKRTIENFESLFKVTNLHINIKKDKKIDNVLWKRTISLFVGGNSITHYIHNSWLKGYRVLYSCFEYIFCYILMYKVKPTCPAM